MAPIPHRCRGEFRKRCPVHPCETFSGWIVIIEIPEIMYTPRVERFRKRCPVYPCETFSGWIVIIEIPEVMYTPRVERFTSVPCRQRFWNVWFVWQYLIGDLCFDWDFSTILFSILLAKVAYLADSYMLGLDVISNPCSKLKNGLIKPRA